MSGNFVHCKRERQRIVYIYNMYIIYVNIARQRIVYIYNIHIIYVNNTLPLALACSARNFQTFLGHL